MSQAKSNYMVDADVVSCCLHALVLSIITDLIMGMEELELHISDAEADLISEELEEQPFLLGW